MLDVRLRLACHVLPLRVGVRVSLRPPEQHPLTINLALWAVLLYLHVQADIGRRIEPGMLRIYFSHYLRITEVHKLAAYGHPFHFTQNNQAANLQIFTPEFGTSIESPQQLTYHNSGLGWAPNTAPRLACACSIWPDTHYHFNLNNHVELSFNTPNVGMHKLVLSPMSHAVNLNASRTK